jgi:dihydrofolate reductase
MAEANAAGMVDSDAMLLGRVTYEEFASYWPYQNSAEQPFTDYLNNTPKYVVSTTLQEPLEWQNSTLIKGNVAEEIAKLKRGSRVRTLRSSAAAPFFGRCCARSSSTSLGSWFIP